MLGVAGSAIGAGPETRQGRAALLTIPGCPECGAFEERGGSRRPGSAIPARSCFAARSRASGRAAEAGMHGLPKLLPRPSRDVAARAMCPMAAAGQITMADSADCPAAMIVAAWSS